MAALDGPPQRTALADEMRLADELAQIPGPHPGGERLALGRRLEECLGACARETRRGSTGRHAASLGGA